MTELVTELVTETEKYTETVTRIESVTEITSETSVGPAEIAAPEARIVLETESDENRLRPGIVLDDVVSIEDRLESPFGSKKPEANCFAAILMGLKCGENPNIKPTESSTIDETMSKLDDTMSTIDETMSKFDDTMSTIDETMSKLDDQLLLGLDRQMLKFDQELSNLDDTISTAKSALVPDRDEFGAKPMIVSSPDSMTSKLNSVQVKTMNYQNYLKFPFSTKLFLHKIHFKQWFLDLQ